MLNSLYLFLFVSCVVSTRITSGKALNNRFWRAVWKHTACTSPEESSTDNVAAFPSVSQNSCRCETVRSSSVFPT
ncbi:hypothetical protein PF002_g12380 [Phytophthora fragariae]|uniref:Secreted protein n=1 Tax=Phytophthora fragariae TaxID=53985 RepID=A0A6A3SEH9_9STRA|nr:hypothetical protein PF003_g20922 [Phytophthora fragariae]KAE8948631.1 hypothetical protein PF009_g1795 [Phytophthora fragariae]KAE9114978.1 hypothetical protein PF007_g10184 [Phytophthora fragariae]KAE9232461.1 hypothetical protein PF002_g12380 [Phytophthora fragariae]KAE9301067.1 hypothetical protein PF001_g14627 [Phytophthora fragariae]